MTVMPTVEKHAGQSLYIFDCTIIISYYISSHHVFIWEFDEAVQ